MAPAEHSPAPTLSRIARPALIAGITIALVCLALLMIVFALDSFNATVYSVNGKDIQDATEEAREIRDSYAGTRFGAVVGLVAAAVVALASGAALFLNRGKTPRNTDDDGEDVDLDDLTGR
ncbi:hypothetical protein J7E82_12520 [Arthrobacter sp. ISL-30]|nr:hypothetical protein [Arthrobacter sp. ISL-30]